MGGTWRHLQRRPSRLRRCQLPTPATETLILDSTLLPLLLGSFLRATHTSLATVRFFVVMLAVYLYT